MNRPLAVATIVGLAISGIADAGVCQDAPDAVVKRLQGLRAGSRLAEVDAAFGSKGLHQFTASFEENTYVCSSYHFWEPHIRLYVIFKADRMLKVVEPPSFVTQIVHINGAKIERRQPWSPEGRVQQVMNTPGLSRDELAAWITRSYPHATESNLGPAIPLLVPGLLLSAVVSMPIRAELEAIERRYDGGRISVGLSRDLLKSSYGQPDVIDNVPSGVAQHYMYGKRTGVHTWVGMCVVVQGEHVDSVYSRDFIPEGYKSSRDANSVRGARQN